MTLTKENYLTPVTGYSTPQQTTVTDPNLEITVVFTSVPSCLCRDQFEELNTMLPVRSIVVLGGKRKWWASREERLARNLRLAGHEVIFRETE